MAYEEALINQTLLASADLSASQYRFVEYNTTTRQIAIAGDGEVARGVLQNAPAAEGRAATVAYSGVSQVEAGEDDITSGDAIASDASGRAKLATTGDIILGRAQEDSSAVGQLIAVALGHEGASA